MTNMVIAHVADGNTMSTIWQNKWQVTLTLTIRKSNKTTPGKLQRGRVLGGVMQCTANSVMFMTDGKKPLKFGTFERNVRVGGLKGPDNIFQVYLTITKIDPEAAADLKLADDLRKVLATFQEDVAKLVSNVRYAVHRIAAEHRKLEVKRRKNDDRD